MRGALVILLIIGTAWDAFTTVYGTIQVLGASGPTFMASLLCGVLVSAALLSTQRILHWKDDVAGGFLRIFWFVSICYDLYTSWIGNKRFIIGADLDAEKTVVLLMLTLIISGSPIVFSLIGDKLGLEEYFGRSY